MKVNERYSNLTTSHNKEGETHMNHYTKRLLHSSTADIEKRKALISNVKDAESKNLEVLRKTGLSSTNPRDLRDQSTLTGTENRQLLNSQNAISDSHKALANHDWYAHNKEWKKEYNKEYYQNNKDYWKKRLDEANARWDKYDDKNPVGEELKDVTGARMDAYSAKINYERAQKEYDDFINSDTYKSSIAVTPVTTIQNSSLIDKGVNLIHSIVGPILGALAKLFS